MNLSHITEPDKAYLAGILDGEGYISLYARKVKYGKSCRPQFVISVTAIEWLACLRNKWANAGNFFVSKSRGPKWKPYAMWTVSGPKSQEILKLVSPYLQIKRTQAELVSSFITIGQGKRRSKAQLDTQMSLHSQVKALNQRGLVESAESPSIH